MSWLIWVKAHGTDMRRVTQTFDPKGDVNQLAHVSLCLYKPQQRPG